MGAFDLNRYVQALFKDVERGPEDMHGYQNTAVQFLIENPFSALFIDLGLGKTCISLSAIIELVSRFELDHALVIAPVRVANETWPTEIGLWRHTAPLSFVHIREDEVVEAVNAAGKAERQKIKAEKGDLTSELSKARIKDARLKASRRAVRAHFKKNPATVHIINREQVEFLVEAWGRDWPYDAVFIDESSCFKDHTTNRFKALRRVRPLIKRMHQLTATPAAETYMHLFAQIFLLDEGERFGRHITHFREEYFTYNPYTRSYKLRPGAEERIAAKISDICLTMKAEDYLDLEKPIPVMDWVDFSPEAMRLYRKMEEESVVELPDGEVIEAETAAALSQKLLQMTSGVLYQTVLEEADDGFFKKKRVVHAIHDDKIEKLQTIVEEAKGETLLVAYWHESSLTRLQKAFPKAVVMDKEGKCIKDWNKGKIPVLLVHPASAGHGLNLQYGGRRIVLFDIPWSLELYLQLIGRLARQGQKHVVFIHHILVRGTIDEVVVQALMDKRDAQEILFRLLKRLRNSQQKTTVRCKKYLKVVENDL